MTTPSTPTAPAWTRSAQRLDRPDLDVWWKPDQHGPLDGILIWQGDLPTAARRALPRVRHP